MTHLARERQQGKKIRKSDQSSIEKRTVIAGGVPGESASGFPWLDKQNGGVKHGMGI